MNEEATHINGLFCVALLDNADRRVCDEDEQDHRRFHEGAKGRGGFGFLEQGQDEGDDRRAEKNENELVFELFEDKFPEWGSRFFR